MVKATAWKYQKCVCARPVLKRCPGTSLAASGTHTHRAARTPGGAENLLLQLGAQRGSGAMTLALTGQCAMAQLLLSPGLQHILHLAASVWRQKPFEHPQFAVARREDSLHCGHSALLENKRRARKVAPFSPCVFFHSDRACGCFRSNRWDTL